MKETLKSVGIDIGTTTTQLVFSRIEIENKNGAFAVPRFVITKREVFYRSKIYFTPLIGNDLIDGDEVRKIVVLEYQKAGVSSEEIGVGAVIITGETARKENAKRLLHSLSDYIGDFVVATAGSDLESAIAAQGSGAASFSKEKNCTAANFDIGGGTTNIALFENGTLKDTTCLDIGGRLVRVEPADMRILYMAPKIEALASRMGLSLRTGEKAETAELRRLARRMASFIDEITSFVPESEELAGFITSHRLSGEAKIGNAVFSGGVADCIYGEYEEKELFKFGDIGILLGQSVRECSVFRNIKTLKARETINATVIGAGSYTVGVSGSTINYSNEEIFPLKNIPVIKAQYGFKAERGEAERMLARKAEMFMEDGHMEQAAVGLKGIKSPSYSELSELADYLVKGLENAIEQWDTLIIVLEEDMGKALGNRLSEIIKKKIKIVSIDGIAVGDGDYIDIGRPMAGGRVIPVVVKTLIFGA